MKYSAELAGECRRGPSCAAISTTVQDIIRHAHDAATTISEVWFLSDADSLDDIGGLGVWRDLKRSVMEGRAVEDAVRAWQRREQYGYWEARIRDAFRLETRAQPGWPRAG